MMWHAREPSRLLFIVQTFLAFWDLNQVHGLKVTTPTYHKPSGYKRQAEQTDDSI